MKTPPAAPEKKPREPRLSCSETNFSQSALNAMEQAMGIRLTRLPAPIKPPTPATDAD